MRATLARFIPAVLMVVGLGGRAAAQVVVNVNFHESFTGSYSGQGAVSDPGHDFWNDVTTSSGASDLLASDGTTQTTISIAMSGGSLATGQETLFASALFEGYYYVDNGSENPAYFTISGLEAGRDYSFYLYGQSGAGGGRPVTFTLEGSSQDVTGDTQDSFVYGENYVGFRFTPSGTSVSGSFVGIYGNEADFNGIQIVAVPVSVPELSTTAALMGAAALAGALVLRRSRGLLRA